MPPRPEGMSDEDYAESEELYELDPAQWAEFMIKWWEDQGVSQEEQLNYAQESRERRDKKKNAAG